MLNRHARSNRRPARRRKIPPTSRLIKRSKVTTDGTVQGDKKSKPRQKADRYHPKTKRALTKKSKNRMPGGSRSGSKHNISESVKGAFAGLMKQGKSPTSREARGLIRKYLQTNYSEITKREELFFRMISSAVELKNGKKISDQEIEEIIERHYRSEYSHKSILTQAIVYEARTRLRDLNRKLK
jgi:hypothetical protein